MIFVDTSFWAALTARTDAHNAEAVILMKSVGTQHLLTSNHVRGEMSRDLEREALDWLRRRDEREYSFVDATSFMVMRSLRIEEALAFDGDFAAAGFAELRA